MKETILVEDVASTTVRKVRVGGDSTGGTGRFTYELQPDAAWDMLYTVFQVDILLNLQDLLETWARQRPEVWPEHAALGHRRRGQMTLAALLANPERRERLEAAFLELLDDEGADHSATPEDPDAEEGDP